MPHIACRFSAVKNVINENIHMRFSHPNTLEIELLGNIYLGFLPAKIILRLNIKTTPRLHILNPVAHYRL